MRNLLTLVIVGLVGLLAAASIGYAAYVVSRDTVGSPVTKVKLAPNELAPVRQQTVSKPKTTTTAPSRTTTQQTTTVEAGDDHSGRGGDDDGSGHGRNRGRGGDDDD